MPGLVKIGKTTRSAEHRALEISQGTGVPGKFAVAYQLEVDDCELAERFVHEKLKDFRFNDQREFFQVGVHEAIEAIQVVVSELELATTDEEPPNDALPDGLTKLMRAVLRRDEAFVARLLAKGDDPSEATEDGVTPLMMAAAKGYNVIVDLLLENHAQLDARAKDGTTAKLLAKANGHITTLNVLGYHERGASAVDKGVTSLTQACTSRDCELVVALLRKGSDPNEPSKAGDLPLDIAARSGCSRIVEILLKAGATSTKAEILAERNGHFVAAELIRKHMSQQE